MAVTAKAIFDAVSAKNKLEKKLIETPSKLMKGIGGGTVSDDVTGLTGKDAADFVDDALIGSPLVDLEIDPETGEVIPEILDVCPIGGGNNEQQ